MNDIEALFEARFGLPSSKAKKDKALEGKRPNCHVGVSKMHNGRHIGVVKWYRAKGGNGIGYVVTNDFGFKGWRKKDSDFVELRFTGTCLLRSYTPKGNQLVAFSYGENENHKSAVDVEPLVFNEKNVRLALGYMYQYPKIVGTSTVSGREWKCDVHLLQSIVEQVEPNNDNLSLIKAVIESYLKSVGDRRDQVLRQWLADTWFAERLRRWMPPSLVRAVKNKLVRIWYRKNDFR